jgi:hypothetical protein
MIVIRRRMTLSSRLAKVFLLMRQSLSILCWLVLDLRRKAQDQQEANGHKKKTIC